MSASLSSPALPSVPQWGHWGTDGSAAFPQFRLYFILLMLQKRKQGAKRLLPVLRQVIIQGQDPPEMMNLRKQKL